MQNHMHCDIIKFFGISNVGVVHVTTEVSVVKRIRTEISVQRVMKEPEISVGEEYQLKFQLRMEYGLKFISIFK